MRWIPGVRSVACGVVVFMGVVACLVLPSIVRTGGGPAVSGDEIAMTSDLSASVRPADARPVSAPPNVVPPRATAAPVPAAKPAVRGETGEAGHPAPAPASWEALAIEEAYGKAPVLAASEKPQADNPNRLDRVRVVRAEGKYPLIRIEETIERDPMAAAGAAERVLRSVAMAADHILVKVRPGMDGTLLAGIVERHSAKILKKMLAPDTYLVALGGYAPEAVPEAIATLQRDAASIMYAEPDYILFACRTPNDPRYPELFGMNNTGQTGGTPDADIDAPEAWDIHTGSKSILVGVIDTGIDYNHVDLASNMWVNAGETGLDTNGMNKATNGVDDDANGLVDDWHGWDFCNDDNNPMDDHYHGTHCAGTIGGVGNNATGVAGVCWNLSIVALKFLNSGGSGSLSDAVDAIHYGTTIRVRLSSNSWGGGGFSQAMTDAIEAANSNGILFVAAAGNSGADADVSPMYPAAYTNRNIISVAAVDHNDALASFSNYGATSVDLGAPGVSILSCKPGNDYQLLSGTSMATPHVAGACALMMSLVPGLSHEEIKSRILDGVDPIPALTNKCVTGGRLNVFKTLLSGAGAYLVLKGNTMNDGTLPGTSGDGDGVVNPGECIGIGVTLRNVGSETATGVTARLVRATNETYITVTTGPLGFGDIPSTTDVPGTNLYLVNVDSGTPTPHPVLFALEIQDQNGHGWTQQLGVTVYTSSHVSGTVRLDSNPLAGARVEFSGPISGSALSGAGGTYMFGAIDGTYAVVARSNSWLDTAAAPVTVPPATSGVDFAFTTATVSGQITETLTGNPIQGAAVSYTGPISGVATSDAGGDYSFTRVYGRSATLTLVARHPSYFDSLPLGVTVPGNATNVDFQMGVSDIRVSPPSFDVTLVQGNMATQSLAITNLGGAQLTWSAWIEAGQGVTPGGKILTQFSATNAGYIYGIANDGTALWISGSLGPTLYKLDRTDGHVLGSMSVSNFCASPWGLTYDGNNLWIAGYADQKIHAVDPKTGTEVKSFNAPGGIYPIGIAWDGSALWVKTWLSGTGTIYRVSADDGGVLSTIVQPTNVLGSTYGLTHFNGALWLAPYGQSQVYKISTSDGHLVSSFTHTAGYNILDLCDDGQGGLWLGNYLDRKAFRVTSGEALWLTTEPSAGVVPRTNSTTVAVGFDSTKANPGVQTATLHINSNDPETPDTAVPVTLTVITPYTIGGTVWKNGFPMADATVSFTGPNDGWVATAVDGTYWFYAGTGTYNLVASHTGDLSTVAVPVTIPPSGYTVDFTFMTATISGQVTNRLTGAPIEGATVQYGSALTGAVTTAADGRYSITRVFGQTTNLSLVAKHPSYYDSRSRSVTVPPNVGGVDFGLGIPDIVVAPTSITVVAALHQAPTRTLAITNVGGSDLDWSIPGGTNYTAVDSAAPGGPAYSWIEISGTGTRINGLGDDTNLGPFPIGFEFRFYNQPFTTFRLCGNGFLSFTSTGANFSNTSLPNAGAPENLVAFFWDDLNFSSAGAAYYQLVDSQTLVVEFNDVPYFSPSTSAITCEAILKADGSITFQYKRVDIPNTGTIGIQNATRTVGLQVAYNDNYCHTGLAVRLAPAVRWLDIAPKSGTLPAVTDTNVTLTFIGTNAGLGTVSNVLHVYSNDPDSGDLPVSLTFTVTNDNRAVQITGFSPATPFTMPENSSQAFSVTASDPDGDPMTYGWKFDGATVSGATSASYTYSPNYSAAGAHTVAVTVNDGWGGTATQTWAVTVTNVNRAPTAQGQSVYTPPDTALTVILSGSDPDGDALTYSVVTPPANGTLTGTGTNRLYMPALRFMGVDTFTFTVNDGLLDSAVATVRVTVADVNTAMLVYWRLDETNGTEAADSSGNTNAGIVVGAAVWTNGTVGGALSFNGSSQYVRLPNMNGLAKGNTPHTMAAWIKVNALPSNRAWIALLGNEGSGSHHWLINSSGSTQFGVWSGSQVQPSLPVGQWKHVAVTFDGTTLKGYVDGSPIGTSAATFNLQGLPLSVAQIHNGENYFNGVADDVRVYDRALSADDVAELAGTKVAITATAGTGGTITPAGRVRVATGQTQEFAVAASPYYAITNVAVDAIPVGVTNGYTFADVTTNHTIDATFAAFLAARGTPLWWLASFGWTTNFDAVELLDTDHDGMVTWKEYLANTDPTNVNSVLSLVSAAFESNGLALRWWSAPNRQYAVSEAASMFQSFTVLASNLPATPPMNCHTVTVGQASNRYYRVVVQP